jgi:RNA polymerase primary sigma factor
MLGGAAQERDRSPIDAATQEALKEKIDQALSVLGSLEQQVIMLRYGLSDGYTRTLDEVAGEFGITPEHVREIESSAVRALGSRRPPV